MNTRLARILSVAFHPLTIPAYIFTVLFYLTPDLSGIGLLNGPGRSSLLLMLVTYTFVAPSLLIYGLYRTGFIRSLEADNLKDRRMPYLFTALIYASATYFFGWQFTGIAQIAPQIAVILGGITATIGLLAVISIWWQISAHSAGLGGMIGFFGFLGGLYAESRLLLPFTVAVLLTGWVTASRLQLNAHTPAQVLAGLALGLLTSLLTAYLFF